MLMIYNFTGKVNDILYTIENISYDKYKSMSYENGLQFKKNLL